MPPNSQNILLTSSINAFARFWYVHTLAVYFLLVSSTAALNQLKHLFIANNCNCRCGETFCEDMFIEHFGKESPLLVGKLLFNFPIQESLRNKKLWEIQFFSNITSLARHVFSSRTITASWGMAARWITPSSSASSCFSTASPSGSSLWCSASPRPSSARQS